MSSFKKYIIAIIGLLVGCGAVYFAITIYFSSERQNTIERKMVNIIGSKNGVVEQYSMDGKVIHRFLEVEKLSTATSTIGNSADRPYRYSVGYHDKNLNGILDEDEKRRGKVYFEIPESSTYIFFEN